MRAELDNLTNKNKKQNKQKSKHNKMVIDILQVISRKNLYIVIPTPQPCFSLLHHGSQVHVHVHPIYRLLKELIKASNASPAIQITTFFTLQCSKIKNLTSAESKTYFWNGSWMLSFVQCCPSTNFGLPTPKTFVHWGQAASN